jgi:uncharacterized coiled-coil DUF342 family protein
VSDMGSTERALHFESQKRLSERIAQLERELAEAIKQRDLASASADRNREMASKLRDQRDQWREVAEELMNSAMDLTDGIEWPPFDNAREKFRKLKEASK